MSITWSHFDNGSRSIQGVTTALTESAPVSSGDGVDLSCVRSVRIYVDAPSGQTFDGTGTWVGYLWSPRLRAWKRATDFDFVNADLNGLGGGHLATIEVSQSYGRLAHVPSGIGVSGGTALTISYEAAGPLGGVDL